MDIKTKNEKSKGLKIMSRMNITIAVGAGIVNVYTIEFKKSDFMKVVDLIGTFTVKTVFNQSLFKVV